MKIIIKMRTRKVKKNVVKIEWKKVTLLGYFCNFNGNTSDELTLHNLIVMNWNDKNGYTNGYKRINPQRKEKTSSPLVHLCS